MASVTTNALTPLQDVERGIALDISLEADEHADCLRRTRRRESDHRRCCCLPPAGHDRHDPTLEQRAVATTGVRSAARHAQMMGDWCRQVSWLTAHAHRLRLPAGCPAVALGATLAAYSCGGSRGMEEENPRTAFPFHPPRPNRSHGR